MCLRQDGLLTTQPPNGEHFLEAHEIRYLDLTLFAYQRSIPDRFFQKALTTSRRQFELGQPWNLLDKGSLDAYFKLRGQPANIGFLMVVAPENMKSELVVTEWESRGGIGDAQEWAIQLAERGFGQRYDESRSRLRVAMEVFVGETSISVPPENSCTNVENFQRRLDLFFEDVSVVRINTLLKERPSHNDIQSLSVEFGRSLNGRR